MKNILLIIVLSMFISFCKSNQILQKQNKNLTAFNYIRSIELYKNGGINVVDSLMYISQMVFFDDFNNNKKGVEYNLKIIDSLERVDTKYQFKNEYSISLKNIRDDRVNTKYNLYFSKPINDVLSVEIIDNSGNKENTHAFLTMFGASVIYTFVFNSENEIGEVNKKDIIYN